MFVVIEIGNELVNHSPGGALSRFDSWSGSKSLLILVVDLKKITPRTGLPTRKS